jgi:hypothetical protein
LIFLLAPEIQESLSHLIKASKEELQPSLQKSIQTVENKWKQYFQVQEVTLGDLTDAKCSEFAGNLWSSVVQKNASISQWKQFGSFLKFYLQPQFGVPQYEEDSFCIWPRMKAQIDRVHSSQYWKDGSAKREKKPKVDLDERKSAIMLHEPCSALCLRNKVVYVLQEYGQVSLESIVTMNSEIWSMDLSRFSLTFDQENARFINCTGTGCAADTGVHGFRCPFGVCKQYVDLLGPSARFDGIHFIRQAHHSDFRFIKRSVGLKRLSPQNFFANHLSAAHPTEANSVNTTASMPSFDLVVSSLLDSELQIPPFNIAGLFPQDS